jgi:hypothetical protein
VRVSRRIRPSRVGCGSTSARRRLLHTQSDGAQVRPTLLDQSPTTAQMTAIGIGFVEARETLDELPLCARVDPPSGHASIVFGSRARGR